MKAYLAKVSLNAMKRLVFVALAVLVLAACQDAVKPELTTPGVSFAYQGAPVSTFTVINTNDAGMGSLRQAILDANASPGFDAIEFNITAGCDDAGVCTIQPVVNLPSITDAVLIDGYTQTGASPNTNPVESKLGLNTVLKIEIDGSLLTGADAAALVISIPNTTVRGLVINRVFGFGIRQIFSGIGNNIIEGNFIGTNVAGTVALGNQLGVEIGTANNRIGDTTAAARNLISGNLTGLQLVGTAAGDNVVQGNLIGTDVTGLVALGNTNNGVVFAGFPGPQRNNLVGGTAPGARNVISGNGRSGVGLSFANDNRVQGNFIGTDITGTVALGNSDGVSIGAADNNTIGGTAPGTGNVISGNLVGVSISQGSTGNRVEGNFIGTDETGSLDLGNSLLGVHINNSPSNTIGGMVPGAGNIIAYNADAGVAVGGATSTGNAILSNAIFANVPLTGPNKGLGIDLAPINSRDGVTPNDPGDGDTGGNNLQNFPVLTSATTTGAGSVSISGDLNSTASTEFTLQFFAGAVGDPSGHGEGETFLGSASVTTDFNGDASFSVTFPATVPVGQVITATATDPDNNTSEFSAFVTAESDTPVGADVEVNPVDETTGEPSPIVLTFDNVTGSGATTVTSTEVGEGGSPPPQQFRLGAPPTYYNIETTATFTSSVEVCIGYTGVSYGNESKLKLLHFDDATAVWEDVTTFLDTENDIICGSVTSFSLFLLAESNVAPVVTTVTLPSEPVLVNGTVSITATFTDANPGDVHTASIDWGDGVTTAGVVTQGAGTVAGSHAYPVAGVYTITVTVTEDVDPGFDLFGSRSSTEETTNTFVVVYDPSGGFVTGGGWINSPPGAYKPDASVTGKANFGFVSRYEKGVTVPTGNTEFRFKAGDLNFHSSSYEFLVVTMGGTNAQDKGSGTINGGLAPNGTAFRFMIWAGDDSPDTFRIRIWWENGEENVVYDNGFDQALGGGSIVIHSN